MQVGVVVDYQTTEWPGRYAPTGRPQRVIEKFPTVWTDNNGRSMHEICQRGAIYDASISASCSAIRDVRWIFAVVSFNFRSRHKLTCLHGMAAPSNHTQSGSNCRGIAERTPVRLSAEPQARRQSRVKPSCSVPGMDFWQSVSASRPSAARCGLNFLRHVRAIHRRTGTKTLSCKSQASFTLGERTLQCSRQARRIEVTPVA